MKSSFILVGGLGTRLERNFRNLPASMVVPWIQTIIMARHEILRPLIKILFVSLL